jgi:hypothetical protein
MFKGGRMNGCMFLPISLSARRKETSGAAMPRGSGQVCCDVDTHEDKGGDCAAKLQMYSANTMFIEVGINDIKS